MTKEASEYCEVCKHCKEIDYDRCYKTYVVVCSEGMGLTGIHTDAVIYCRRRKIKKKKKEN